MSLISKLLILLVSIGTSGVGCYATYNSLFSSSPQVTDQAFNDGFDLKNVNADQYLKIDSTLSSKDQQIVIGNNYNSLSVEINNLRDKCDQQTQLINSNIYDSEEKRKQIEYLNKLDRELDYKLAVSKKLISKFEEIPETQET